MTVRITIIRKAYCLLTAYRLEHYWRKLNRLRKKDYGQDYQTHWKKLQLVKNKIQYLTASYTILTQGIHHPERVAI